MGVIVYCRENISLVSFSSDNAQKQRSTFTYYLNDCYPNICYPNTCYPDTYYPDTCYPASLTIFYTCYPQHLLSSFTCYPQHLLSSFTCYPQHLLSCFTCYTQHLLSPTHAIPNTYYPQQQSIYCSTNFFKQCIILLTDLTSLSVKMSENLSEIFFFLNE